jgi:hypothetical protein
MSDLPIFERECDKRIAALEKTLEEIRLADNILFEILREEKAELEAEVTALKALCEYADDHIMSYHLGDEDYVLTGDSVEDAKQVWRDADIWRRDYIALIDNSNCEHNWVDARNEHITSGQFCTKCNAIKE